MTKEKKAKPGSARELAEMYPLPESIEARIIRVDGDGAERKVSIERVKVTIYKLPIVQLARVVQVLDPVLSVVEGSVPMVKLMTDNPSEFYAVVSEATGVPVDDVANFDVEDFFAVLNGILRLNADFFLRRLGLATVRLPSGPGRESEDANGDGAKLSPSSASGASPILNASPSPSSALQ